MTTLGLGAGLGRARSARAFRPIFISGLAAWYAADRLSSITGGSAVSQWNDLSANGRHLVQGAAGSRPSTGAAAINGRNALRFDGADDFLYNTSPFMHAGGACTIFIVHKAAAQNGGNMVSEASTSSTLPLYQIAQTGSVAGRHDDVRIYIRTDSNATLANSELNASAFNNAPEITCVSDSGSEIRAYIGGLADNALAYTRSGGLTLNSFCVGAVRRSSVSSYFTGDIGEIIIYNRVLSPAERNRVGRYLSAKWRIHWTVMPEYMSAANVPDASGGDAGKGFTVTGLAHDPTNDSFWAGNDGRNVEGDLSHVPSLVNLSKDGGAKLGEILLSPLYPSVQSIQGLAYDSSDDTLWFVSFDEGLIRHVSKGGANLGSITPNITPNGLAYNPNRDSLFICDNGAGELREYSCETGALMQSWSMGATGALDQLWYDDKYDRLWLCHGANLSNGFITVYNTGAAAAGRTIRLPGTDAIEGIYMDGVGLWVANDAYFHNGNPALNRILKYSFDHRTAY